jgi:hypothetical protein
MGTTLQVIPIARCQQLLVLFELFPLHWLAPVL